MTRIAHDRELICELNESSRPARFEDPKSNFIHVGVGGGLFSCKEPTAIETRHRAGFERSEEKMTGAIVRSGHEDQQSGILRFRSSRPRPKLTGQAGFAATESPCKDVFAWLHFSGMSA